MFKVKIHINNKVHFIDHFPGESLLDSVIKSNLNPPYSCMEGFCQTCKARLIKGEVESLLGDQGNFISLGKSNEILMCMSRPKQKSSLENSQAITSPINDDEIEIEY